MMTIVNQVCLLSALSIALLAAPEVVAWEGTASQSVASNAEFVEEEGPSRVNTLPAVGPPSDGVPILTVGKPDEGAADDVDARRIGVERGAIGAAAGAGVGLAAAAVLAGCAAGFLSVAGPDENGFDPMYGLYIYSNLGALAVVVLGTPLGAGLGAFAALLAVTGVRKAVVVGVGAAVAVPVGAAVGGVAGAAAGAIGGFIVTGASTQGYGTLVPILFAAIGLPVGAALGALGGPAVAGALGGHWVAADVE